MNVQTKVDLLLRLNLGTCRAALMSVADGSGFVNEPTSVDTWKSVLNAVIDNVQSCVLEGNGIGGMHFVNGKS